MDCFAVSIACGLKFEKISFKPFFRIAFFFGFFQAIMPLIGWLIGVNFKSVVEHFDHWVAFIILSFLGFRMIYEYYKNKKKPFECNKFDTKKLSVLLTLSVATSIDALAVGFSFAFLDMDLWVPVLIIGMTSFIFTILGLVLSSKHRNLIKIPAELIGGIVLIGIGAKILVEHILF
jgi:putative Mn2+ efflux pump MntP